MSKLPWEMLYNKANFWYALYEKTKHSLYFQHAMTTLQKHTDFPYSFCKKILEGEIVIKNEAEYQSYKLMNL